MTLTLDNFNGMELLWNNLPKKPDENHTTISLDDIDTMWHLGTVDTVKFSIDEWRAAFDNYGQADGTYVLSREEFLAMEPYRYKGEVMLPFDAMLINEGKYTDEGLQELIDLSIAPSCSYTPTQMHDFMTDLKESNRDKRNLIRIDVNAKAEIKKLVEGNPSPLRRLELMFDYLVKDAATRGNKVISTPASLPEEVAMVQASSFTIQPLSEVEAQWKVLTSIEQKAQAKDKIDKSKTTKLKKVKRSRKGLKG